MNTPSQSKKLVTVDVSVLVDGKPRTTFSCQVEEWAVDFAIDAARVQLEEPDYELAADSVPANDKPV